MNWYKFASKNVVFPIEDEESLEIYARQMAEDILENYDRFIKAGEKQGNTYTISYTNPYSGNKEKVEIDVVSSKLAGGMIATYDHPHKKIYVFPRILLINGFVEDIRSPKSIDILESYLIHEMVHAIDPKKDVKKWQEERAKLNKKMKGKIIPEYFIFPAEFDAFSKQISYDIKEYLLKHKESIKDVYDWLRKPINLNNIPYFLNADKYKTVFNGWIEVKISDEMIRKLKQRIINEIGDQQNVVKNRVS